ncbi:dienelactone hydrolase [Pseudoneurospora amorphoporcata]|uniref:Dienelactone hydrolase n=1 Tax=Pseudoneurospora amorphoporcata TaxID=241081 RepID=A0AAN6NN61_9PEZI|nr:dienelactone hydrolase [Pseudoneurospora amorphoporcata]
MASNPPSKCCVVGFRHEGEPTGSMTKVADKWDAYIATPSDSQKKSGKALLFLPDIIGIWQNSKLMADQLAAQGYLTLVLDIFNGDPLPLNRPDDFDFMGWMTKGSTGDNPHTKEAVDPIVQAAIKALKEQYGATKIGALGYCFGAKSLVRHMSTTAPFTGIDVGFIAHPSFVDEKELAAINGPLSIAAAETDSIFPAEKRHKSEEILKEKGLPYQINLYSQVVHGFAMRADLTKKQEKFAREQAFAQAVSWFGEYLE